MIISDKLLIDGAFEGWSTMIFCNTRKTLLVFLKIDSDRLRQRKPMENSDQAIDSSMVETLGTCSYMRWKENKCVRYRGQTNNPIERRKERSEEEIKPGTKQDINAEQREWEREEERNMGHISVVMIWRYLSVFYPSEARTERPLKERLSWSYK